MTKFVIRHSSFAMNHAFYLFVISTFVFFAVLLLFGFGWPALSAWFNRQSLWYDRVLVNQLMIDIRPDVAAWASIIVVLICAAAGYYAASSLITAAMGGLLGYFVPLLVIRHLEQKRYERLESQLVDGITALASGVRAGLTLVQAIELLVANSVGPIRQEFSQLLREYQMGLDLNQAMRNCAARIGSPNYRILFTAIEMHRTRGGDTAESLDRINASIRELLRLEGKLDALTAQGRYQAWGMAVMPLVFLGLMYLIEPDSVGLLFTEPRGRILMLVAFSMIVGAVVWIRRILSVDL